MSKPKRLTRAEAEKAGYLSILRPMIGRERDAWCLANGFAKSAHLVWFGKREYKPKQQVDVELKIRRCLMCRKDFRSWGAGNRRCERCASGMYRSDAAYCDEVYGISV